MSLYKSILHKEQTKILVWHITETLEELHEGIDLTEYSLNRLASMHSEIHQRGYLSVRQLLKILEYKDSDLFYTPDGKPHLKDGKRISITHSFEFSAYLSLHQNFSFVMKHD